MSAAERTSETHSEEQANEWAVRANGQASGPVFTSWFLVVPDHCAAAEATEAEETLLPWHRSQRPPEEDGSITPTSRDKCFFNRRSYAFPFSFFWSFSASEKLGQAVCLLCPSVRASLIEWCISLFCFASFSVTVLVTVSPNDRIAFTSLSSCLFTSCGHLACLTTL